MQSSGNGSNGNNVATLEGFREAADVQRFDAVKGLTQSERLQAHQKALKFIQAKAGREPSREEFRRAAFGKYPRWITGMVVGLSLVVLLTAFILSAMRLYHIGNLTFFETLQNSNSAVVAGYAIVLLSEASAVLFTIALSVIGQSSTQRRILLVSVGGSAALALSGNYYVALHGHAVTVFSVLESMLPPLMTLSTAYVLKELLLNIIEQRHADQNAYIAAVAEWDALRANPEDHPDFVQAYANEIRDRIYAKNRKDSVRAMMANFTAMEWSVLVNREIQQEDWFQEGAGASRIPLS